MDFNSLLIRGKMECVWPAISSTAKAVVSKLLTVLQLFVSIALSDTVLVQTETHAFNVCSHVILAQSTLALTIVQPVRFQCSSLMHFPMEAVSRTLSKAVSCPTIIITRFVEHALQDSTLTLMHPDAHGTVHRIVSPVQTHRSVQLV